MTTLEASSIVQNSGIARVEDTDSGVRRITIAGRAQMNWRLMAGLSAGGAAMAAGGRAAQTYAPEYVQYAPFGGVHLLMMLGVMMMAIGILSVVARVLVGAPKDCILEVRSGTLRVRGYRWRRPYERNFSAGDVRSLFADRVGLFAQTSGGVKGILPCAHSRVTEAIAYIVATGLWGDGGFDGGRNDAEGRGIGPLERVYLHPKAA
jgi:hypothetical protein